MTLTLLSFTLASSQAGVHSSVTETFGSSNSMSEDEIEAHIPYEQCIFTYYVR